jgi:hypothetical protein
MLKSDKSKNGKRLMMKARAIFLLVISILISISFVSTAGAVPPRTTFSDSSVLAYMCRVQGGVWSPPSAECGGCYYCLFPDGTLINCDGDNNCSVQQKTNLVSWVLLSAIVNNVISAKQSITPPDLVPLLFPATTPPEGFCQRNDQGQLLLKVYNQGGTNAVASTTRVIFAPGEPGEFSAILDVSTPALEAYTATDLPAIAIPDSCWDANNNCRFTIGVDAGTGIAESNETNNNAAGLCGAQFQ